MAFEDEKVTLARAWGGRGGPPEGNSVPLGGIEEMTWADFLFFQRRRIPDQADHDKCRAGSFFYIADVVSMEGARRT
jgi:hypothetical protein